MRKLILLAVLLATPVNAAGVRMHCYRGYGETTCSVTPIPDPAPLRPMTPEEIATKHKWESFCQPQKHLDQYGVTRLSYAHSGCEFGRSE